MKSNILSREKIQLVKGQKVDVYFKRNIGNLGICELMMEHPSQTPLPLQMTFTDMLGYRTTYPVRHICNLLPFMIPTKEEDNNRTFSKLELNGEYDYIVWLTIQPKKN